MDVMLPRADEMKPEKDEMHPVIHVVSCRLETQATFPISFERETL